MVLNDFIPNNHLQPSRVFERFYTGDTTRKKSTGLGLAIVKLLLEKIGGRAEVAIEHDRFVMKIFLKSAVHK